MQRVKSRTVRRANEFTTAGIKVDRDACVRAGAFASYKVAVREVDEQAILAVGGIGKLDSAIGRLACAAYDGSGMSWRR